MYRECSGESENTVNINDLSITIEQNALVIRISVEALCQAVEQSGVLEHSDAEGNVSRYRISDPKLFAESVRRQLERALEMDDMPEDIFAMVIANRDPGVDYGESK